MSPTALVIPGVSAGVARADAWDTLLADLATPAYAEDAGDLDATFAALDASLGPVHSRARRNATRPADRWTSTDRLTDAETGRDLAWFAEAEADDTGRTLADAEVDLEHLRRDAHRALMARDRTALTRVAEVSAATIARVTDLATGYLTATSRRAARLRADLASLTTRIAATVRALTTTLRAAHVIARRAARMSAGPAAHSHRPPPAAPASTSPHTSVCTLLTAPQAPPAGAAARV